MKFTVISIILSIFLSLYTREGLCLNWNDVKVGDLIGYKLNGDLDANEVTYVFATKDGVSPVEGAELVQHYKPGDAEFDYYNIFIDGK